MKTFLMLFFVNFVFNWTLKLFMAWLAFQFSTWLGLPDWAMIALIAIAAAETHFKISGEFR